MMAAWSFLTEAYHLNHGGHRGHGGMRRTMPWYSSVSSVVQDVLTGDSIPTRMTLLATFLLLSTMAVSQDRAVDADVVPQGSAATARNKLEEARDFYKDALLHSPGNPSLVFELGMIYFRQREWEN